MNERLRDLFGFTPTDDFHLFWEFACNMKPSAPLNAFNQLTTISLAGPFDLLAGRFDREKANYDPCLHWRYFGDTPEFVTILVGGTDGLHWGYVVDDKAGKPRGIAGYYAHDDVSLFQESPSPFGVLWNELKTMLVDMEEDARHDPQLASDPGTVEDVANCQRLLDSIDLFCSKQKLELPEIVELDYIDHCNLPPPFPFPEPDEFSKLPGLVHKGITDLASEGLSALDASLRVGRMLWHWHNDGNPLIEESAFELLDDAYQVQRNEFLRHVLREHRKHRHRRSLDVFDA